MATAIQRPIMTSGPLAGAIINTLGRELDGNEDGMDACMHRRWPDAMSDRT